MEISRKRKVLRNDIYFFICFKISFYRDSLSSFCFSNKKKKINKIFAEESPPASDMKKNFEKGNSFEDVYKRMSSV